MSKVLLVGQAPGPNSGKLRAFDGPSGRRLADMLGMGMPEFFAYFETVNLLAKWPGKHAGKYSYRDKGDRFPMAEAKRRARKLARFARAFPVAVFAGARTAKACGHDVPFLAWFERPGGVGIVIPHPSGCNILWNDPTIWLGIWGALDRAMIVAARS